MVYNLSVWFLCFTVTSRQCDIVWFTTRLSGFVWFTSRLGLLLLLLFGGVLFTNCVTGTVLRGMQLNCPCFVWFTSRLSDFIWFTTRLSDFLWFTIAFLIFSGLQLVCLVLSGLQLVGPVFSSLQLVYLVYLVFYVLLSQGEMRHDTRSGENR